MAFKIKKLYHSPAWYRENCRAEDGGYAVFRKMLTTDMKFIGADIDTNLTYEERITPYEEKWNEIMSRGEIFHERGGRAFRSDAKKSEMLAVIERESLAGFRPSDQFKDEPFKTIDELMTEAGINENAMREFLSWRSRRGADAERTEVEVRNLEPASDNDDRDTLRRRLREGHQFFE